MTCVVTICEFGVTYAVDKDLVTAHSGLRRT